MLFPKGYYSHGSHGKLTGYKKCKRWKGEYIHRGFGAPNLFWKLLVL
jgi:hypothetical protein